MRKKYPYLQDSYFQTTLDQEKEKRSILDDIQNFVNQRQYIKITLLDWKERPIRDIEGEITSGSITKNATSPVRRTANLSCAVDAQSYSFTDRDADFAINKKIFLEIGIKNETDKYPEYPIFWFPEGVFFISSFSINSSAGGSTNISLTLKDKMAMLNGEVGGTLPAMVTFDSMDTQLPDGSYITKKVLIYNIIKELVNHYGSEDLNNIVIEDVPLRIRRVIRWNGVDPIYRIGTPDIADIPQERQEEQPSDCYFTLEKPSSESGWIKYNPGDDIGYIRDDFVITGELVGNAGETVVSILDKIKNTLGNYEYFYDVFGIFHFREIKNYLNTTQGKIVLKDMREKDYLIEINNDKSIFTFSDDTLLTSITSTPLYENIKNDFVIQGTAEDAATGIQKDIRYHLAIDKKPRPIGQDTRATVEVLKDYSEEIAAAQEDIKQLQKLLNYYNLQASQATSRKAVINNNLRNRQDRLRYWGDLLKREIQNSLEEYGVPADQVIPGGVLTPLSPEEYSITINADNEVQIEKPDFYNLDFVSQLAPGASEDSNFDEELLQYLKTFKQRANLSNIVYNNLTPEGYWKILINDGYNRVAVQIVKDEWKRQVFQWAVAAWKVYNEVEGWHYVKISTWDEDNRKLVVGTDKNGIVNDNTHAATIVRPAKLSDGFTVLFINAFNQKNNLKLSDNQLLSIFNKVYDQNTDSVNFNFYNYWVANYNVDLFDSTGNLATLSLEKLCTDRSNYLSNIPMIYLRYDGYEQKINTADEDALSYAQTQFHREIEWATACLITLNNMKTNWGVYWQNNTEKYQEKVVGTYSPEASFADEDDEWSQTWGYEQNEYVNLEKDIAFCENQIDYYTKMLDTKDQQVSTVNQALSNLILRKKYDMLNWYYNNYIDEIKNVWNYKNQLENLENQTYDYLLVPEDTNKISNDLKSINYFYKNTNTTIRGKCNGAISTAQQMENPAPTDKVKATLWLPLCIDILNEAIDYWENASDLEEIDNPHLNESYYGVYTDRPLVFYEDLHTGLIRAGFAYIPDDSIDDQETLIDGLPEVGNFNLVYGTSQGPYYKWNGSGYTKLNTKLVSLNTADRKQLYYIYDWRTFLYLAGEYAHMRGTDTGYYYPELAAFWNQTYDLINQKFFGEKSTDDWAGLDEDMVPHILTTGSYFLDFLDSIDTTFGEWSVDNIGRRTDMVVSDEVNCLFQPEIPNVNLLDISHSNAAATEIYDISTEVPDSLKYLEPLFLDVDNNSLLKGADRQKYLRAESVYEHEPYIQVESELYNNFVTGGYANGAYDQIKYELFLHTRYQNSVSLTAIPVFYLEPNSRVTISDKTTNTFGDYIVQNISITFGPGANMSVSCTEAMERF